ncbi:unnamed protein product [Acanthoscelides obtectus]|nr:unnamed protein product [Acanthoscelides obtectus]CAK1640263.1 hypothetical protein AOBTE_LOCUS11626 [Acanthoscelides obtectus]
MFDASHMMCVTRNNLMKHSLKMEDGGETSWKHIKTFFVKESGSDKKNTKLTESHIKPNKYERTLPALAIDVLSNTVAIEMKAYVESGKLSKEVLATAECISIFDRLLHMLNSVHESSVNEYASGYKATKQQTEFLEKVIRFLQTLKVYDNKGEDKTGEVKFVNAWLTTVRGLMKLWEYVKEREYEFLLTGNISSVPLDKFVNTCRLIMFGYNNPSPLELLSSFRDVSVASYFTFETPLPMEDMDIETLALLVYKRIPAVRHNLGNQSQQSLVSIDREECITMMLERLCLDMRF